MMAYSTLNADLGQRYDRSTVQRWNAKVRLIQLYDENVDPAHRIEAAIALRDMALTRDVTTVLDVLNVAKLRKVQKDPNPELRQSACLLAATLTQRLAQKFDCGLMSLELNETLTKKRRETINFAVRQMQEELRLNFTPPTADSPAPS